MDSVFILFLFFVLGYLAAIEYRLRELLGEIRMLRREMRGE
jgi:hypothetical protein